MTDLTLTPITPGTFILNPLLPAGGGGEPSGSAVVAPWDYVIWLPTAATTYTVTNLADPASPLNIGTDYDGWIGMLTDIHAATLSGTAKVFISRSAGILPPGTGTIPPLGHGRTDWLEFEGEDLYHTGFQLSNTVRRMHSISSGTGIDDIYYTRYLRFKNVTFDANSSTWGDLAPNRSLFGADPGNIYQQMYVGFEYLEFLDICLKNGPIPNITDDSAGKQWRWFNFDDWHNVAMEGTAYTGASRLTNIKLKGVYRPPDGSPAGGYKLIQSGMRPKTKSNPDTGLVGGNTICDEIYLEDFYYDSGADTATDETHAGGGGCQFGFYAAYGGKLRVRNGTFVHCADIPTSCYNFEDALIENVTSIDGHAFAGGCFAPTSQTGRPQKTVWRNVTQKFVDRTDGLVGWNITGPVKGGAPGGILPIDCGTFKLENCRVEFNNANMTGTPRYALWVHPEVAPDLVDADIAVDDRNWVQNSTMVKKALIQYAGGELGVKKTRFKLRLVPRIAGTTGIGTVTYPFVQILKGAYVSYDINIEGVDVQIAGSGLSSGRLKFLQHSNGSSNEDDIVIVSANAGVFWIYVNSVATSGSGLAWNADKETVDAAVEAINGAYSGLVETTKKKNDDGVGYNYDLDFNSSLGPLTVLATDGARSGSDGVVTHNANTFSSPGNTLPFKSNIDIGRVITIGTPGVNYTIGAIVSDTAVTLTSLYAGSSSTTAAWSTPGSSSGGDGVSTIRQHVGNDPSHEEGDFRLSINNITGCTGPQYEQWDTSFDLVGPCYFREIKGGTTDGQAETFDGSYPNGLNALASVTADYSMPAAGWMETVLVDATTGPVTVTLAKLRRTLKPVTVKKTDGSANDVTIAAGTGETIDDAAILVISDAYESVTLIPGATQWRQV